MTRWSAVTLIRVYLDPVVVSRSAKCFYNKMVKYWALKGRCEIVSSCRSVRPRMCNIWSSLKYAAGNLGLTYNGHWIFQPPTAYLGDEQMLQILGRGHSVPTVTELIFVRAQYLILGRGHSVPTVRIDICESTVLNHFAIKAFCSLWNDNWIQLSFQLSFHEE